MRRFIHRILIFGAVGLALAVLATGCTLVGADSAPLTTPVGDVPDFGPTDTPSGGDALPDATTPTPVDIYATLTAQAAQPTILPPPDEGDSGEEIPPPQETPTETPVPVPETTEPPAGDACPATHTVQPGENLYRIALKYGLTVQQLAEANGITNPDVLPVGTVLKIPGCGGESGGTSSGATTDREPQPGDTVDEETGDILHVVQAGENLYRIALRYGVSWKALAEYNKIAPPYTIHVGQVIRIPTR